MKFLIYLLVLLCVSTSAAAQVTALVHKEEKRKYRVYTPASYASNPEQRYPVLFNFHGGGMTMAEQLLYTQINKVADRHRFIVVYPSGIKQDWNHIGYTEALLAKLTQDFRVDSQRVYTTGLSRGGFFAFCAATELPHLFAAVAAVGAPMPEPVVLHHTNPGKVGMMLIHGTADKVVAYKGKPTGYRSAEAAYNYWLKQNGIAAASVASRLINADAADGTEVVYLGLGNGAQSVALATIKDGGHTWPGADGFNVGLPIGMTSRDIDGNEMIWQFLGKHRK